MFGKLAYDVANSDSHQTNQVELGIIPKNNFIRNLRKH